MINFSRKKTPRCISCLAKMKTRLGHKNQKIYPQSMQWQQRQQQEKKKQIFWPEYFIENQVEFKQTNIRSCSKKWLRIEENTHRERYYDHKTITRLLCSHFMDCQDRRHGQEDKCKRQYAITKVVELILFSPDANKYLIFSTSPWEERENVGGKR